MVKFKKLVRVMFSLILTVALVIVLPVSVVASADASSAWVVGL